MIERNLECVHRGRIHSLCPLGFQPFSSVLAICRFVILRVRWDWTGWREHASGCVSMLLEATVGKARPWPLKHCRLPIVQECCLALDNNGDTEGSHLCSPLWLRWACMLCPVIPTPLSQTYPNLSNHLWFRSHSGLQCPTVDSVKGWTPKWMVEQSPHHFVSLVESGLPLKG